VERGVMKTERKNKGTEQAKVAVVRPRLVKANELAAREAAAEAEAERVREMQTKERPVIRTPRNAMEARDVFNSLFNAA
jgi:hypothetical protein